jgi:hypothetical protein
MKGIFMPNRTVKATGKFDLEKLQRLQAPGFVSVYANNTNSTNSFYEVRLLFGQIIGRPDAAPIVEDSVMVTMTWEHAVRVRDMLSRILADYERDQGPIRLMKESSPPKQPPKK